jgi:ankyrin repeat protein
MRTSGKRKEVLMPVKRLPANPDLDHLKHQAKDLLKQHSAKELSSAQRLREFHPKFRRATDQKIFAKPLSLSDAQLSIARERGFISWTRLKRHIEKPSLVDRLTLPHHQRIEDPAFRHAVDLIDAGNVAALRSHLAQNPHLIHRRILFEGANYFRNPSLLEFIAENPIRHGAMPANIVDVTKTLLQAGPDPAVRNETLILVATGRIPRECKVQIPLIETLCAYGADPNSALHPAALHGELESVHALIRLGAKIDLPILAALAKTDDFLKHLPSSGPDKRHLSLALAAQYGHVEIVRSLLDAGQDPNRYNPPGAHAHSTPLHQAALAGHIGVVKLLVQRGARLDIKDVLWQGTPADWAEHAKRPEIESYLREQQKVAQRE